MFKLISYFFYTLCLFISFYNGATTYYKCITEKGTTFSQFPCDEHAITYKIKSANVSQTGPEIDYKKQLNELERESLLSGLKAELRSNKHKLSILDREKERAEYKQTQRLNHILADDDKKRITKDITKTLKVINKEYKKNVVTITNRIKKIEKKITQYQ